MPPRVRSGAEVLTRELMEHVKNDEASERARKELEAAFNAHRLTAEVHKRHSRSPRK